MRYLALFAGIHAPGVAWDPLGWECVGVAEIEKFPSAVLAHRYPEVPNLGDVTKIDAEALRRLGPVDLVVAGAPCQAFSVAGLRKGLADPRGNLTLELLRVVDALRPRWLVYENVPGIRTATSHDSPDPSPPKDPVDVGSEVEEVVEDEYESDEVHAFSCFLAGLQELGYGWSYRSLDARYFGLAQRRQRVFVVASPGNGAGPRAVLLEREGLCGNPPSSRAEGPGAAGGPANCLRSGGSTPASRGARSGADDETLVPEVAPAVDASIDRKWGSNQWVDNGQGVIQSRPVVMSSGQANAEITEDQSPTLSCLHEAPVVAGPVVFRKSRRAQSAEDDESWVEADEANTLNAFDVGDVRATELVAFSSKAHGGDSGDVAPALRAADHGGAPPAVAFAQNQREEVRDLGDCAAAVKPPGTHEQTLVAQSAPPGFINPRQIRGSETSNQVGIKPDAEVSDALSTDGPGAVLAPAPQGVDLYNQELTGDQHPPLRTAGGHGAPAVAVPVVANTLRGEGHDASERGDLSGNIIAFEPRFARNGRGAPDEVVSPLKAQSGSSGSGDGAPCVVAPTVAGGSGTRGYGSPSGSGGGGCPTTIAPTLTAENDPSRSPQSEEVTRQVEAVHAATMRVRRLTPRECEALQGFPRDWTRIPYGKKPAEACPDGPRYKAIGNSMAVPVMRWIGERLSFVDAVLKEVEEATSERPE